MFATKLMWILREFSVEGFTVYVYYPLYYIWEIYRLKVKHDNDINTYINIQKNLKQLNVSRHLLYIIVSTLN